MLFPKLVFLYDENLHGEGGELEDVFEAGVDCSQRSMYPDWLSLTGDGYVAGIYKRYGKVLSPMGCRAFLSPWFARGGMKPADDADEPVFVGRFNIGAVSLHLPMIYAKAQKESRDFYEVLDYYLELIRKLHLRTYDYLGEMRASTNPLAYCEGGFYGGHLGIHDKIKPLLASATASFGITALNELQELHNHKSLVEDGRFALEVMEHINEKVAQFKEEDGRLYAMYGTPAESLCGLQVEQFRKKYGIVENVSDRPYVSNSFHCHVSEEITPIEKQDLEGRFWDLMNGGKIQQMDAPETIYSHPANEFTARFVGFENFFPLKWDGSEYRTVSGGEFHQPYAGVADIKAACRPEDIAMEAGMHPGERRLHGHVLVRTFLGKQLQYLVETPEGNFLVNTQITDRYEIGDQVTLFFAPEKTISVTA